jgi:hypothetical protein
MPTPRKIKHYVDPPHPNSWYQGYPKDEGCETFFERVMRFKKNPKKGRTIEIVNLPHSREEKPKYLIYWAPTGKKKSTTSKKRSFQKAYGEDNYEMESMPSLDFKNLGIIKLPLKTDRTPVKVKLEVNDGYNVGSQESVRVPPHIHYRICSGSRMGKVYTRFLE